MLYVINGEMSHFRKFSTKVDVYIVKPTEMLKALCFQFLEVPDSQEATFPISEKVKGKVFQCLEISKTLFHDPISGKLKEVAFTIFGKSKGRGAIFPISEKIQKVKWLLFQFLERSNDCVSNFWKI